MTQPVRLSCGHLPDTGPRGGRYADYLSDEPYDLADFLQQVVPVLPADVAVVYVRDTDDGRWMANWMRGPEAHTLVWASRDEAMNAAREHGADRYLVQAGDGPEDWEPF